MQQGASRYIELAECDFLSDFKCQRVAWRYDSDRPKLTIPSNIHLNIP